jgi:hypothetical protein
MSEALRRACKEAAYYLRNDGGRDDVASRLESAVAALGQAPEPVAQDIDGDAALRELLADPDPDYREIGERINAGLLARQAPEPVAPYLWEYTYAANGNTVLDREEPLPELVASGVFTNIKPLYTHPAGMDAARAKAIEECLQVAQDMLYAGPTAIIAAIRALKEAR